MICHPETSISIENRKQLNLSNETIYYCEKCNTNQICKLTTQPESIECNRCGLKIKDDQPDNIYFKNIEIEEIFYIKNSTYIKTITISKIKQSDYSDNWSTMKFNAIDLYTHESIFFEPNLVFFIKQKEGK